MTHPTLLELCRAWPAVTPPTLHGCKVKSVPLCRGCQPQSRTITGCLRHTHVDQLPVLAEIAPSALKREAATLVLARRAGQHDHLLHYIMKYSLSLHKRQCSIGHGSSAVECRTRNQVSPGSNPPLLLFRRLGIFVLSIDASVESDV